MQQFVRLNLRHIIKLFAIIYLLAFSCTLENAATPLYVESRVAGLVIFNNTNKTINFTALERRAANYTHWMPCGTPEQCGDHGIKPGMSGHMPYSLIYRWYPGSEVSIFWWQIKPDSIAQNGYRVDGPYEYIARTPLKAIFKDF